MELTEIADRADKLASELAACDTLYPYEWDYFMREIDLLIEALKKEPLTFSTDKP